jgi:D-alanine-D-alanine ligase
MVQHTNPAPHVSRLKSWSGLAGLDRIGRFVDNPDSMRIAILYNPRPHACPEGLPDDAFEEYDTAETVEAIAAALAGLGVETVPVVADSELPWSLRKGRFDFVFNIAEGAGRRCREAVPAAVCELLALPYTGSDVLTLAVTLDKMAARRIVGPDVPVARGVLVEIGDGEAQLEGLSYPVLVKPNDEGSSKGIREDPLCRDAASAYRRCRWLHEQYGCPALVEEFLPGAEVTAAVRGNGASAEVLALMEIAPAEDSPEPFIYSVEVKRDFRRRVRYHVPPRLAPQQLDTIRSYALTAFRLLGCRDIARMDFRLDASGQPRFLECNSLPGLNPHTSDIVIGSRGLLSYERLVQGILENAMKRAGIATAQQSCSV